MLKSSYLTTLKSNAFAIQLKTLAKEGVLVASTALSRRSNGGVFTALANTLLQRLDLLSVGVIDTRLPRLGLIARKATTYSEINLARQAQTPTR